jgi:transcription-repair coupling factor (superfamily II helicase)
MSEQNYQSPLAPELPTQPGERHYWERLNGSSKALALIAAARNSDRPLIVITTDMAGCTRLLEEFRFYLDNEVSEDYPLLSFPDWETLPYDLYSTYQDIISDRLATLSRLSVFKKGILIVSISTLLHRLLPREYLAAHSLALDTGQKLDLDKFRHELHRNGYRFVSQVLEHGDVALRGSLLDIYPMGAAVPYRIDLFDEEIDSIRIFDPESQRSSDRVETIQLLPAREAPLDEEHISCFRSGWRARFAGNPMASPVYHDVSSALAPAGIEYYLPMFYPSMNSLFDYLDGDCLVVFDGDIPGAAESFRQDISERYEQGRYDQQRPLLPPEELFFDMQDISRQTASYPQLRLSGAGHAAAAGGSVVEFATRVPVSLPVDARAEDPLVHLKRFLGDFPGRVLLVAESSGRRETLLEMFTRHGLRPRVFSHWSGFLAAQDQLGLTVAPLERGAIIETPLLAVISESQLFGDRVQQRRLRNRRQQDLDAMVRNLTELTVGAPVVHEEHGVGRYCGLVTLEVGDIPGEYIQLEYDQGDKLYVPVASLDLISRYTGVDPEHAPLHRLGSGQWLKARRKAAERVRDVAAELLELHARRAARAGIGFAVDENAYQAFVQGFPFEETPGQQDAITDVLRDLAAQNPMDRLICGDSGFGKTEVAMRASFIAVQNNRQVVVLVPTTLLAQQHFKNFKDRFADWPVRVEVLSRFLTKKQQDTVLDAMQGGQADIVIGTHKLLQEGIRFARLGLVIIDEEHRFGVRQKERLKALRSEVDILTLTATPIPRTLNMALTEIRDLSIIASPPLRRLPVKSFICEWSDQVVKEAMLREIKRGGQVYFLHNKVDDIEKRAAALAALIPQARVRLAHGQMPEKELEQVMLDFYHQRFNVLVCTTIIETGIDVPNANTIIIDRADKFGLSQLYQLRGRVGRSHHRAYAYLLIPSRRALTGDAAKRLEAIESMEDLGIGFTLATHDLEIRGAGEILGEDQSGQIQEIGYGLYMELLERAVTAIKSGKQPELDRALDHGTEVDLHIAALIPEDYLPDVHTRLIMYKRVASARTEVELQEIREEMIDRFGMLPRQLKNLFVIAGLKQMAAPLGVRKIDLGEQGGRIYFSDTANVDPARVINLIQSEPRTYRFDGHDKLRVTRELPTAEARIELLEDLLESISARDAA